MMLQNSEFVLVKNFFKKTFQIPNDWDYPHFSEVVKVNPQTKINSKKVLYAPMDAVNIQRGSIDYFDERKIDDNPGLPRFQNNDILFARITPSTENGKICIVENFTEQGIASSELIVLRATEKVIPRYLFYFVQSHRIKQFAISQMMGTTGRQRVPDSVFKKDLRFELPPLNQQQKIASILSKVDELIQKMDQIIHQTQELEKGLLQRLLSRGIGHNNFKKTPSGEIPESWQIKKMKDLISSYKNGIYKKSSFYGRGVLNIRMFNIQNGKVNARHTPQLEVTNDELVDYGLNPGDILLNRVNSPDLVGKAGIIELDMGPAVFDSMIIRIRVLKDFCVPEFLNYFLNSKAYFKQIGGVIKHAIGQSSLNQDDLNNLTIRLPPLPEQDRIVSILSKVQRNIESELLTKNKIDTLKRGLLQKLLTGKIRVKV